jgi:hypothetical protein
MSRRTIPAHAPGLTVVVGWDNPLRTYFAQVTHALESDDDESDPIVFWTGGEFGEVPHAENLVAALAPYTALTPEIVAQLRTDRAACGDRGPSPLQREMLRRIGRRA